MQAAPGTEGAGYSGDRPGGHNEHLTLHQAQLGERLYPRVRNLYRLNYVKHLLIQALCTPDVHSLLLNMWP